MAKRETIVEGWNGITFLGQEYPLVKNTDPKRVDRVYRCGKVTIETWGSGGDWSAQLDHDFGNVGLLNQRGGKKFRTESAALRDLETNARRFLRALGVEL